MRSRFLTAIDRVDRLGDSNPIHPNATKFPQARRTGAFELRAYPNRPPSKARYRPKQTDGIACTFVNGYRVAPSATTHPAPPPHRLEKKSATGVMMNQSYGQEAAVLARPLRQAKARRRQQAG